MPTPQATSLDHQRVTVLYDSSIFFWENTKVLRISWFIQKWNKKIFPSQKWPLAHNLVSGASMPSQRDIKLAAAATSYRHLPPSFCPFNAAISSPSSHYVRSDTERARLRRYIGRKIRIRPVPLPIRLPALSDLDTIKKLAKCLAWCHSRLGKIFLFHFWTNHEISDT